jgi:hypothetical protein
LPPGEETGLMLVQGDFINVRIQDTEDHEVAIGYRDKEDVANYVKELTL